MEPISKFPIPAKGYGGATYDVLRDPVSPNR